MVIGKKGEKLRKSSSKKKKDNKDYEQVIKSSNFEKTHAQKRILQESIVDRVADQRLEPSDF